MNFFHQIMSFPFEENRLEGKFLISPFHQASGSSFSNRTLWVLCAPSSSTPSAYLMASDSEAFSVQAEQAMQQWYAPPLDHKAR